jgi:Flp pilus assembly protein TadG
MTSTRVSTRRPTGRVRGQALVEFALVAPIFFFLILATIEAGRFMYHYAVLNNATREGARYAIIHGANSGDPTGPPDDATGADVKQAVRDASFGLVGTLAVQAPVYSPLGSECGVGGGTNDRGSSVNVGVTFSYPSLIPIFPPISLSAESCLVVNN